MARIALLEILLFLLPFAAFALYLVLSRRGVSRAAVSARALWLAAAGLLLVVGSLALLAGFSGEPTDGVYVPPHYKDGVLVPGHIEPRRGAPAR